MGLLSSAPVAASALRSGADAPIGTCTNNGFSERCHLGKRRLIDPRTGKAFWQMTDGHCNNHAGYFYNQSFSEGERYLIFNSDRSGATQLYRQEVDSGATAQATFFEGYSGRPVMHPGGREVFYIAAGPRVWATEIETLRTRQVLDASDRTDFLQGLSLSGDGRRLLVTYPRSEDGFWAIGIAELPAERVDEVVVFEPHPRRGRIERLSHPQFNPTRPDLVSIVLHPDMQGGYPDGLDSMGLPDEMRARVWLVNLNSGTREPFVVAPVGFRATHDYWAPDGAGMYFHQKAVSGWFPASIEYRSLDGRQTRTIIRSDEVRLGHSMVDPSQTWIVSDDQTGHENGLWLVDVSTGEAELLMWPNTSNTVGISHVHPSFSRSGRRIVFTSDVTGYAQVYMVDLDELAL